MMICLRAKLAYLAFPKTATTAVEAALAPHCPVQISGSRIKHLPMKGFQRYIEPMLADRGHAELETTCQVRDPISWLGSWYAFRRQARHVRRGASTFGASFDRFVDAALGDDPPPWAKVGRASIFVTGRRGARVRTIYRYEAMEAYRAYLSDRIGAPLELPRVNVSPKAELALSRDMRQRVERVMAEDFELYESALT
ncbi:MAG: gamma-glutamyl kinase [Pseudomonadota bacterium]